jgi:hypothetical protein
MNVIRAYQNRAMKLLERAIELTPDQARTAFWRDVVQPDPALGAVRRLADYARLAQTYGLTDHP